MSLQIIKWGKGRGEGKFLKKKGLRNLFGKEIVKKGWLIIPNFLGGALKGF